MTSGIAPVILGAGCLRPAGIELRTLPSDAPRDVPTLFDIAPYLRDKKSAKLMSMQDKLALAAATMAVQDAGLSSEELRERTGIYLAVGMLPFEDEPLRMLADKSQRDGTLDLARFSTEAYLSLNPLLTFKCLPNMPVFHISYNMGIHGRYYVTYPGSGQWARALDIALTDLAAGRVDYGIVGAVADQRNFLIRSHQLRTGGPDPDRLFDCAAVLVIGRGGDARAGAKRASLSDVVLSYVPKDPFEERAALSSESVGASAIRAFAGPVAPALELVLQLQSLWEGGASIPFSLSFEAGDGTRFSARIANCERGGTPQ